MKKKVINTLIKLGMPARTKGFHYIVDAVCLMSSDECYVGGNTIALYTAIAEQNGATPSRVERAIRHAFEQVRNKGNAEIVEQYFGNQKPSNSNLLNVLYLRLTQEE